MTKNPQIHITLAPLTRTQLEHIMERHAIASLSQAIAFCVAGAFHEMRSK